MSEAIESTASEVVADEERDERLEVIKQAQRGARLMVPAPPPTLAVTPQVKATELVERLEVIKQAQHDAMVEGIDYGEVPGTNKPTLLKPGAEKLSVLFQLDVQLLNEKTWGPGDHLTVVSHATVFHAPTGSRLGYGEGVCTTRERKYAYRTARLRCPECGQEAVLKSKQEPGWFCWRKRGGCGENFAADDRRIAGQELGEIENPDLPDLWNTVVKMAEKRARVDAVLAVTGASALFTQDAEDQAEADAPQAQQAEAKPKQQNRRRQRGAQPKPQPITDQQKSEIAERLTKAGLHPVEASVCRRWWMIRRAPQVPSFDQLTRPLAQQMLESLGSDGSGALVVLNDCLTHAKSGDERAQQLEAELEAQRTEREPEQAEAEAEQQEGTDA